MPIVGGFHFLDFEAVIRLMVRDASGRGFVVDAERGASDDPDRYVEQFVPSIEALEVIQAERNLFDFAVIPESGNWLVLSSAESFVVVIGTPQDVGKIIGEPVFNALAQFSVQAYEWMQPLTPRLGLAVAVDWHHLPGGQAKF